MSSTEGLPFHICIRKASSMVEVARVMLLWLNKRRCHCEVVQSYVQGVIMATAGRQSGHCSSSIKMAWKVLSQCQLLRHQRVCGTVIDCIMFCGNVRMTSCIDGRRLGEKVPCTSTNLAAIAKEVAVSALSLQNELSAPLCF